MLTQGLQGLSTYTVCTGHRPPDQRLRASVEEDPVMREASVPDATLRKLPRRDIWNQERLLNYLMKTSCPLFFCLLIFGFKFSVQLVTQI